MDVFAFGPAILGAVVGSVVWLYAAPLLNVSLPVALAVGAGLAVMAYSHFTTSSPSAR